jgi:hypothetical protein
MMEKWNKLLYSNFNYCFLFLLIVGTISCRDKKQPSAFISEVGLGWSQTSVNATIFRKNSVVSTANYQFVAYYDSSATVVIARRKHNSNCWEIKRTQYKGNVTDAHNTISIMADGDGYLHLSWDHHNNPLNYSRSLQPEGLAFGDKEPMTGDLEMVVSYPEFYRFANGDLLFAYRDGGSGNGNLVLNKYNHKSCKWNRLQRNLIDGEGQRNAYWQLCIDRNDAIHISWVWRETPDVKTNHDMCYARSLDGGETWENSADINCQLPITDETAEVICPIPPNSNLINQTSMTTDKEGKPFIATYFKAPDDSCTQFYVIYQENGRWTTTKASHRTLDFELGGVGSLSVPISRPQIVVSENNRNRVVTIIYRDEEVGNNIVMATACVGSEMVWRAETISPYPVDRWEPSFDTELWRTNQKLHLYFQKVGQGQGETSVGLAPQMVGILEITN